MPVPDTVTGLVDLIHDAAQLSVAHDDLKEKWEVERAIQRTPDDPLWAWRGWLGFCVLAAYVASFADPSRPPDEEELNRLRDVFADQAVGEVMLLYYGGRPNGDTAGNAVVELAHRSEDDHDQLIAISMARNTRGLLPEPGQPTTWRWELHRVGTSALVLAATPPARTPLRPKVAVKVIVPPYLQWEDIRRITRESGSLYDLECDALPDGHGSTEAVLVTSFIEGPTLAEVMAARESWLASTRGDGPPVDPLEGGADRGSSLTKGVRFARRYWLPIVTSLAELDRALQAVRHQSFDDDSSTSHVMGHGDLNPSNIIFRDGSSTSLRQRGAVTDRSGLHAQKAMFVDVGPSHLLQANPGSGMQSITHLSRYTAPELLRAGRDVDRQKADLYSLGDLLLDALVPGDEEDGVRISRVYRHSFDLGQLVDSLRSYDPEHRTAIHRRPGHPFSWSEFVTQVERILEAAETLHGTGLRGYSLLSIVWKGRSPYADPATRKTAPEDRAATIGSREAWTIYWLRLSRLAASFFVIEIAFGIIVALTIGCDSPFGSSLCSAIDIIGREGDVPGWGEASTLDFGILGALVSLFLAAHLYYVRIFAQLRPALCRGIRWRTASEVMIRVAAAPAYFFAFMSVIRPDLWWIWSAAAALGAGINNWFFAQFLHSAAGHLRRHAEGPASRDSLASAANSITAFVAQEYGRWWLMMGIYGIGFVGMGVWLAMSRLLLDRAGLTDMELEHALSIVEWPLVAISIVVNLTMLYRNCSEMGEKAPEVRATGARAIAGCLRLDAARALRGDLTAP